MSQTSKNPLAAIRTSVRIGRATRGRRDTSHGGDARQPNRRTLIAFRDVTNGKGKYNEPILHERPRSATNKASFI